MKIEVEISGHPERCEDCPWLSYSVSQGGGMGHPKCALRRDHNDLSYYPDEKQVDGVLYTIKSERCLRATKTGKWE